MMEPRGEAVMCLALLWKSPRCGWASSPKGSSGRFLISPCCGRLRVAVWPLRASGGLSLTLERGGVRVAVGPLRPCWAHRGAFLSRLTVEDFGSRFGLFAPPAVSPSRLNVEESASRLGLFAPPALIGVRVQPMASPPPEAAGEAAEGAGEAVGEEEHHADEQPAENE